MRNGTHSRKYWVIFQQSQSKHWTLRFLDPYFRHVCIACKSEAGYFWVVADSRGDNMFVDIYPADEDIRSYFPDSVILETWSTPHNKPKLKIWCINCVEIVKKVLGIRSLFVLTPYQLYKFINGGQNERSIKQ